MPARLAATFGFIVIGLLIPYLEVNDTHVFNPDWTPHARLHEVWQLLTNTTLAMIGLWLVWFGGRVRAASVVGLVISAAFVGAYLLRDIYGGSTTYADGSVKIIFGLNATVLAVYVMGLVAALFAYSGITGRSGSDSSASILRR